MPRPSRIVRERLIKTPFGTVHAVELERGRSPAEIRDIGKWVHPYRPVAGVTDTTEVLLTCGHELPRFDLTPEFKRLESRSHRYPRSRLCPECLIHPPRAALKKVAGPDQLASDWGSLTKAQREQATFLLDLIRSERPMPDIRNWNSLTPEEKRHIAVAGEHFTAGIGLTFREYLFLHEDLAPVLTKAGYKRLKATPTQKQKRRDQADERVLLRQLERDYR